MPEFTIDEADRCPFCNAVQYGEIPSCCGEAIRAALPPAIGGMPVTITDVPIFRQLVGEPALPADLERLAASAVGVNVRDGDRVIGKVTAARVEGRKIIATIEME